MEDAMKLRTGLCGVALLILLGACESVISADFDVRSVECSKHRVPPGPPAVRNAGGDAELFVAITKIDFGDTRRPDGTPGYDNIGFDLDGVCSNRGQRPVCRGFDWAIPEPSDGVEGIDNGSGKMIAAQKQFFAKQDPLASAKLSDEITRGETSPIAVIRLRGWNRQNNDDEVEVDWYLPAKLGTPLKGDGTDAWPISQGSFENSELRPTADTKPYPVAKFRDGHAYVTNYQLVVHLPKGTPLRIKDVDFVTEGLTLSMSLSPYPAPRVLDGTFGGFVRLANIFHVAPQVGKAFSFSICRGSIIYPLVRTYFCRFADARADGRPSPDEPCDAMSVAGFFDTTTAAQAGPSVPDDSPATCTPETDPTNETCDAPGPLPPEQ
jgi:hypothetical protein